MRFIKFFESYSDSESNTDKPKSEPSRIERKEKKQIKRCIGKCDRKFFIKDGEPVIYCPSCDRILN